MISCNSKVNLGALWGAVGGHFGITLGTWGWLGVTFGSLWDHFGHMMHIGSGLIGLKSENMHATAARSKIQGGLRPPAPRKAQRAGSFFGSLWCHFAPFGVTLGPLWVDEGYFGVILVRFQKILIFRAGFLRFCITMKSCWGYFGSNFHKNYGRQGPESEKYTQIMA